MRCFVNTDLNNLYTPENDPQFKIEKSETEQSENVKEPQDQGSKNISGPKNALDWKIQEFGINQIQNSHHPVLLISIKKRDISLETLRDRFDAAAFLRYVQQDAAHQNEINELKYIEERNEKARELKEERLEKHSTPKEDIAHQMERIDIERFDAA